MQGGAKAPFYPSLSDGYGCGFTVNAGEFMSWLTFSLGLSSVWKLNK